MKRNRSILMIAILSMVALSFTACPDEYIDDEDNRPPEQKSVQDRWEAWTDSSATATIDFSVSADGVATITIGGVPQVNNESDGWGAWKARAMYGYTAKVNTVYTYTFEAWTFAGERRLSVQYYEDNDTATYLESFAYLTPQRQTFNITGEPLPTGGVHQLQFRGADQLGTFYVKVISITEIGGTNPGGNTANPFVGTWVYSQTRAQLAQEYEVTEQMLISAGCPAVLSHTATFNANMSFVFSSYYISVGYSGGGWASDGSSSGGGSSGGPYIDEIVPMTSTGTYTVSGNTATMTFTGDMAGYELEAVINGNTLLISPDYDYRPLPFTKR